MSPSCERISGYKYSEFIADRDLCKKIVHPEDIHIYEEHILEKKGGIACIPEIDETEYRIITKNGDVRLISHFCRYIKSADGRNLGRRVSNRDITEQKQAELALSENERRYQTLFKISPSGIILLDENGIILESNDAISKILQYTPDELKGKDVRELSLPEKHEKIENDIEKIMSGEVFENEIENIRKDGTICTIELKEIAVTLKGGGRGILATVNDITERKKAEDAEKSLRKQLNKILDLVPSYIFAKDYDGKFLMVNKSLADIFKVPPEEVVGKSDSEYGATPEQIEGYLKADRRVIDTGKELFIKEEQVMRKDGIPGWFQTHKIPYIHPGTNKPAILGIAVDITDRKETEQVLKKNEEKYRTLVDLAVDGILLGNSEGIITDANKSMCEILGMEKDAIIGKHISYLPFTENCIKDNPFRFDLIKRGETVLNERTIKRPDGVGVTVEMRSRMMPDGTYQSIYRDISSRKNVEEEIKQKNDKLFKLNAEKDKFFSIIAHDLRAPFLGFLGYTDLMKKDLDYLSFEEIQDIANNMNISAHNLFDLLTNLLEWSMMQRGLKSFKPEKFLLNNITKNIIGVFSDAAKKKQISIEQNIKSNLYITADEAMLKTILRNLLSNAIKFTKREGDIIISAYETENNVVFSVKDSGIGMSEEMKNNLFKIDKKVRREGTEEEPSTGLGLLLCKDFLEMHNGKIKVESEEGKGSEFIVLLNKD